MQYFDLAQLSLTKVPSRVTELYIPLWVADGTTVSISGGAAGGAATFLQDGGTTGSSGSAGRLHTLNSNWPTTTKFAFEATIYVAGSYTAYATLWDITSNSQVVSSQISTTSTTATVVRSGQFVLIPGHVYGVSVWCPSSSMYISDAHLIVFP
jgi:hypothetical protein